ncbi:hypothetical protein IF2G_09923 [Cordyceps javanica]|nr:hypothetical protein IF2G_09923 [Cordyceps javanica]
MKLDADRVSDQHLLEGFSFSRQVQIPLMQRLRHSHATTPVALKTTAASESIYRGESSGHLGLVICFFLQAPGSASAQTASLTHTRRQCCPAPVVCPGQPTPWNRKTDDTNQQQSTSAVHHWHTYGHPSCSASSPDPFSDGPLTLLLPCSPVGLGRRRGAQFASRPNLAANDWPTALRAAPQAFVSVLPAPPVAASPDAVVLFLAVFQISVKRGRGRHVKKRVRQGFPMRAAMVVLRNHDPGLHAPTTVELHMHTHSDI